MKMLAWEQRFIAGSFEKISIISGSAATGYNRRLLWLLAVMVCCILSAAANAQPRVPDWAQGIVWYQIFPERFCDGDSTNQPAAERVFANAKDTPATWKITPWGSNWFAMSPNEEQSGRSFRDILGNRRYGGDLQGIMKKLDYIKTLGVGAIYLNPIFDAVSLHKYDGSTYHHVDIYFGPDPAGDKKLIASENPSDPKTWVWTSADKLFLEFLRQAHSKGIKVVLDGVFNHTGVQFWAFQDIIKNGSQSPYYDWYQIKSLDDPATPANEFDYKGWWGFKGLPEFNRTKENLQEGVKDYIFAATRRWLDPNNDGDPSDGIDGWRLDVARDIPLGFWKEWRPLVKRINNDAIIIGELWEISPDFIGVNGVFDALMNYNFSYAVLNFFLNNKEMTAIELLSALKEIDRAYPDVNLPVLQNLLSSHDTERLSSMLANPGRKYDKDGDERNPHYYPGKPKAEVYELQKLIAVFQFTYRGAPMIYYGDEVGMWGADDPHCRKPMVWDEKEYEDEVITAQSGFVTGLGRYKVNVDKNLLNYYRRLGAMRNFSTALKKGSLEFILNDDNERVIGFKRVYDKEEVLVYFNASNKSEVIEYKTGAGSVTDLMSGENIKLEDSLLRFALWGNSAAVYQIKHSN